MANFECLSKLESLRRVPIKNQPAKQAPPPKSDHSVPYFDLNFKNRPPKPYLAAVVTNDRRCALRGTGLVMPLHSRDIERLGLKHGDEIEVVPTSRFDYIENGCVRKI